MYGLLGLGLLGLTSSPRWPRSCSADQPDAIASASAPSSSSRPVRRFWAARRTASEMASTRRWAIAAVCTASPRASANGSGSGGYPDVISNGFLGRAGQRVRADGPVRSGGHCPRRGRAGTPVDAIAAAMSGHAGDADRVAHQSFRHRRTSTFRVSRR
ncbi:hypothetical protein ADK97_02490 [Streptomyces sp. H021]|nr:hypothetical protein ADK97_02490 [Streptomyces sp. H021]